MYWLVWVYTCQNVALLEITCHSSTNFNPSWSRGRRIMTVEIISWTISKNVWDQAMIELATPGSTIGLTTDCAMGPVQILLQSNWFVLIKLLHRDQMNKNINCIILEKKTVEYLLEPCCYLRAKSSWINNIKKLDWIQNCLMLHPIHILDCFAFKWFCCIFKYKLVKITLSPTRNFPIDFM